MVATEVHDLVADLNGSDAVKRDAEVVSGSG